MGDDSTLNQKRPRQQVPNQMATIFCNSDAILNVVVGVNSAKKE